MKANRRLSISGLGTISVYGSVPMKNAKSIFSFRSGVTMNPESNPSISYELTKLSAYGRNRSKHSQDMSNYDTLNLRFKKYISNIP